MIDEPDDYVGLKRKSFYERDEWPYIDIFKEGGDFYWQEADFEGQHKNAPNGPFTTSFEAYQDAYKHGGL